MPGDSPPAEAYTKEVAALEGLQVCLAPDGCRVLGPAKPALRSVYLMAHHTGQSWGGAYCKPAVRTSAQCMLLV